MCEANTTENMTQAASLSTKYDLCLAASSPCVPLTLTRGLFTHMNKSSVQSIFIICMQQKQFIIGECEQRVLIMKICRGKNL